MKKVSPQLFLFLIPTLIVALLFIPLLQQSVFLAGEGDYDMIGLAAADIRAITLDVANSGALPVFLVIGSVLVIAFVVNESIKVSSIKNHSPPSGTIV